MTMTGLTVKERNVLAVFIQEGIDCSGAENVDQMLSDNMTWTSVEDIVRATKYDFHQVGGILSALEAKGLIVNNGFGQGYGDRPVLWFASDDAIRLGWTLGLDTWTF